MRELVIGLGAIVFLLLSPQAEAGEIHYLSFDAVQKKCQAGIVWEHIKRAAEGKPNIRLIANGCYLFNTDDIYIRNDMSEAETNRVLKHELRHRAGWRH